MPSNKLGSAAHLAADPALHCCRQGYMYPGDHGSVTQDCSKGMSRSLDLLHIAQLIPYRTAVAPAFGITPGDHRSITQDCSKCRVRSLDLLHIPQLIPYRSAVAAIYDIPPHDDRSITEEGGEHRSTALLGALKLDWHHTQGEYVSILQLRFCDSLRSIKHLSRRIQQPGPAGDRQGTQGSVLQ